jgi:hypothetical protein
MIKKKVKYDRKSILSNQKMSPDYSSSLNSRSSSFIDDVKIQEKIVRGSISHIVPKGAWYPNHNLKTRFSSVFSGSPQPKKVSGINQLKGSNCSMFIGGDFGSQRGAQSLMIRPVPVETDLSEYIDDEEMNPEMQVSASKSAIKCQSGS